MRSLISTAIFTFMVGLLTPADVAAQLYHVPGSHPFNDKPAKKILTVKETIWKIQIGTKSINTKGGGTRYIGNPIQKLR